MVARGDARWGITPERLRGVLGLVTSLTVGVLGATVEAQPGVLTREQVTAILGSTRDLSGKNLAGLDLSKLNLARTNLRRADLGGADLVRARLAGTNLTGADLSEADLTGADLSQAAGRELTVYSVPSRSAGFRYDHYWVRNGQVVEIETAGTR